MCPPTPQTNTPVLKILDLFMFVYAVASGERVCSVYEYRVFEYPNKRTLFSSQQGHGKNVGNIFLKTMQPLGMLRFGVKLLSMHNDTTAVRGKKSAQKESPKKGLNASCTWASCSTWATGGDFYCPRLEMTPYCPSTRGIMLKGLPWAG